MGSGGGAPNPVTATKIAQGDTATFTFVTANNTATKPTTQIVITGQATDTLQSQMAELNAAMQADNLGIHASLNSAGQLQFQSANAFSVSGVAGNAANLVGSPNDTLAETANNTGLNYYSLSTAAGGGTGTDVQVTVGGTTVDANLGTLGTTTQTMADSVNAALQAAGVTDVAAVIDQTTEGTPGDATTATNLVFEGSAAFTVATDFANNPGVYSTADSPTAGTTANNAQVAINSITSALQTLGQTQGKIGAGENTLNYAINLAQSQITNYSSAESQIRDANGSCKVM
jgi:flagellin